MYYISYFKSFSTFSAIQYDVSQDFIPNPRYRCTHHECPWSQYKEDTDFGFWTDSGERIANCERCMERCDNNQTCGSVECGPDQALPSGSILFGYCSWWRKGVCETAAEFTTNPNNYILTCKKQGEFDFETFKNVLLLKKMITKLVLVTL